MTSQSSQTPRTHALTVANAKGGVGKTTIAIQLAGAFNNEGLDVLFVDLDPQGVATEGLGHADVYDAPAPNLYDVLVDGDATHTPDLIVDHPELDFLPSNVDLLNAERELTILDVQEGRGTTHLSHALTTVDAEYDVVLVDAPPYYGQVLDNALYAAPQLVVPALAEGTSQRAVELLFDEVAAFEDRHDRFVQEVAAFANRIRASTNQASRMTEWLDVVFNEQLDVPVYHVPERVDLQYAFDEGVSIYEYNPGSDVTDVFSRAARDIKQRMDGGRSE